MLREFNDIKSNCSREKETIQKNQGPSPSMKHLHVKSKNKWTFLQHWYIKFLIHLLTGILELVFLYKPPLDAEGVCSGRYNLKKKKKNSGTLLSRTSQLMARFSYHTCYSIQNITDWYCPEALFWFFPKVKKKGICLTV